MGGEHSRYDKIKSNAERFVEAMDDSDVDGIDIGLGPINRDDSEMVKDLLLSRPPPCKHPIPSNCHTEDEESGEL